jgi:hypothetical protein
MTRPQPQLRVHVYPPAYYGAPYYYGPSVNFYFRPGYRRW